MEEIDQAGPRSPVAPTVRPQQHSSGLVPAEPVEDDDEVDTEASEEEEDEVKAASDDPNLPGCAHYKRKCQLVCPDPKCDKVYTCRICHDEAEQSHQLDRYGVKEVVCLTCKTRQPVSNCCIQCSTTFGKFFCKICNLFMDVYKDTFHCDGCGLCRVGPKENFFHCEKCQMCMPIALGEGKHKCIENSSQRNCPVCLEDIHTSRCSSHVPPCGHLLHQQCFNQLLRKSMYTCPICNESMIGMHLVWKYLDEQIASSRPLPPEYVNDVRILCRDCHKLSTVGFHFMGLKCGHCGGYNTCIESGSPFNPDTFPPMSPRRLFDEGPEEEDEEGSASDVESPDEDIEMTEGEHVDFNEIDTDNDTGHNGGSGVSQGTQVDTEMGMEEPTAPLESDLSPPVTPENDGGSQPPPQ